jgi:hypothetical protein
MKQQLLFPQVEASAALLRVILANVQLPDFCSSHYHFMIFLSLSWACRFSARNLN